MNTLYTIDTYMARIVHGFHIIKHKYYAPIIMIGLCVLLMALFLLGKIGGVSSAQLYIGLGLSLYRIMLAYALSLVLALGIALMVGQSKAGDFLIPVFDLLQNLPSFALIPLFIAVFGYTNLMVIAFAATSILWPILFYVLHALKTAREDLNDAASVFGAIGWKRARYYLLPLSFSAAVTGSIVGFSVGWEAVIGVEIIGLSSGIGVFLNNSLASNQQAFALGLVALLLVVFIINRLLWMPLLKRSQMYAE